MYGCGLRYACVFDRNLQKCRARQRLDAGVAATYCCSRSSKHDRRNDRQNLLHDVSQTPSWLAVARNSNSKVLPITTQRCATLLPREQSINMLLRPLWVTQENCLKAAMVVAMRSQWVCAVQYAPKCVHVSFKQVGIEWYIADRGLRVRLSWFSKSLQGTIIPRRGSIRHDWRGALHLNFSQLFSCRPLMYPW